MNIIPPHTIKSRPVETPADFKRMYADAVEIQDAMRFLVEKGKFRGIYALAHSQITQDDPLTFFVFNTDEPSVHADWKGPLVVCNPTFTPGPHDELKKEKEGCVTFQNAAQVPVMRFYRGRATWNTGQSIATMLLKGKMAQVFQHEIDHFNAKYVYQLA